MAEIHLQQNQQQQSQLQENNNSSSQDTKESREGLGPDEMWGSGALGHHRELPVDVPDTLLQQAYPNKVKIGSSPLRNEPRQSSRSASNLSLNLRNETLKKSALTQKKRDPECSPLVSPLEPPPIITIELKIQNPTTNNKNLINSTDQLNEDDKTIDNNQQDSSTNSGSPDLKDPLKSSDDEEDDDHSNQKESNVDNEEDYPFAKEDYPTMLKSCSDDSASPRSSSGRSDSTAPLDSSLVLRHDSPCGNDSLPYDVRRIDLGSPCRPLVSEIKVTPIFSRDTTSFENPAYGLADLQGFLMRSDEVTDLTRLLDEQVLISRKWKEEKNSPWKEEKKISKSDVKSKTLDTSVRSMNNSNENSELMRVASTDDLISVDLSGLSSKSRTKKRRQQQTSSGYSTLRSEASTEFDQVDHSFLVVGNKNYREVAVDCPDDFVPVAKSHPVYPPPNKTPANSKHNTLEQKRHSSSFSPRDLEIAHKIELEEAANKNRYSLPQPPSDNSRETVVVRTLEQKHDKKVRSRVKSLFVESFFSHKHHHNHKPTLIAYRTTHSPSALSNIRNEAIGESSFLDDDDHQNCRRHHPQRVDILSRSFQLYSPRKDKRSHSEENLLSGAFDAPSEETQSSYLSFDNPYLNFNASMKTNTSLLSNSSLKSNPSISNASQTNCIVKNTNDSKINCHSENTNDSTTNRNEIKTSKINTINDSDTRLENNQSPLTEFSIDNDSLESQIVSNDSRKISLKYQKLTDDLSSFNREKNQNSRNSLRELRKGIPFIVYFTPEKKENLLDEIELESQFSQDSLNILDESPNTQNIKNSRLSLEYKFSNESNVSLFTNFLEISKLVSKSDVDLPNSLDLSVSKVQSWLSDPHLCSSTTEKQKSSSNNNVRSNTRTRRNCFGNDAPSNAPSLENAPESAKGLGNTDNKEVT